MNKRPIIAIIATVSLVSLNGFAPAALAQTFDCFPLCEVTPPIGSRCAEGHPDTQGRPEGMIDQAEALNNQLKPIKEIVGFIRSPQSLAIKLVNDYIVKIPVWVGYAIDPVGSIKNKVMGEARDRVKLALKEAYANSTTGEATDQCLAQEIIAPEPAAMPITADPAQS